MNKHFITWIKDKYRGYTDNDIESVKTKLNNRPLKQGSYMILTAREFKAMVKECIRPVWLSADSSIVDILSL